MIKTFKKGFYEFQKIYKTVFLKKKSFMIPVLEKTGIGTRAEESSGVRSLDG